MISAASKFEHLRSCVRNAESEFDSERFLIAKNWLGTAAAIAGELREEMATLDQKLKTAEVTPVEIGE